MKNALRKKTEGLQQNQLLSIIEDAVKAIQYGSLTIVKQDNHVIQINTNEVFRLKKSIKQ